MTQNATIQTNATIHNINILFNYNKDTTTYGIAIVCNLPHINSLNIYQLKIIIKTKLFLRYLSCLLIDQIYTDT